ncbi:MAG: fibronectin type III domain-containing protein [Kofleriaceae bacterium]
MKLLTLAIAVLAAGCLDTPDDLSDDELDETASELALPVPVLSAPQPTTMTPATGVVGTQITVSGSNLTVLVTPVGQLPRYVVRFTNDASGTAPTLSLVTATRMVVTVPPGSRGGYLGVYEPVIRIDPITHERTQRLISASVDSFAVVPAAPTDLLGAVTGTTSLKLSWRDNAYNETGFEIWIADPTLRLLRTIPADRTGELINGLTPDTQYQFRVRAVAGSLASAHTDAISVRTLATTGTLRISNNSQYMLTSVRVDNAELLAQPIPAHGLADFTVAGGAHRLDIVQGANLFVRAFIPVTVTPGQTFTATVPVVTIMELLAAFSASARYIRMPAVPNDLLTYTFFANGRYEQRRNNVLVAVGLSVATSWPDNALIIDFRLDDGTTGTYELMGQRFVARPVGLPPESYELF